MFLTNACALVVHRHHHLISRCPHQFTQLCGRKEGESIIANRNCAFGSKIMNWCSWARRIQSSEWFIILPNNAASPGDLRQEEVGLPVRSELQVGGQRILLLPRNRGAARPLRRRPAAQNE